MRFFLSMYSSIFLYNTMVVVVVVVMRPLPMLYG